MIKEDGMAGGPTVSVGGGHIAGAGVPLEGKPANWGEPGVSKKAQKKKQKSVVYKGRTRSSNGSYINTPST